MSVERAGYRGPMPLCRLYATCLTCLTDQRNSNTVTTLTQHHTVIVVVVREPQTASVRASERDLDVHMGL